jgi:eukaryotic-like serine/threonine-protein kinase
MTPEQRWQQAQRIYESALARETAARPAYLADVCVGDEGLRKEIETLLENAASAEHFIEQPAIAAPGALAGLSGLSIGHCIGPYQIVAKLGAGGMGEVYLARDTQLGREVAIKIVPAVFASDPDRVARFEREARLLGSLNHPHIATVHGLEPFASSHALVMELVEGPTLADRIARGPLAVSEALPVACQIAEALEAAHEKGIVHRDLKPANIKITPDSIVKVLDFGLAKAIRPTEGAPELPHSPAFTTGGTKDGVLLGTAAYMSPEQVRGQAVDNRADIWAFGCVLYEMLSGRRAFQGDEVSDILAGILRDDPAWDALPASTPQSIRQLVRRCLEKDRRERLQAIGDARLEISEALTRRTDDEPTATPRSHTSRAKSIVPLAAVAGATALVVGIGTWTMKPSSPAAERLIARSLIAVDPFGAGETPFRTAIAVSPDGRTLVFRGRRGVAQQSWQLFLRPLDRLEAAPIPGTEGAQNPFFSPDGAWIGYWAGREIRRVPTAGGPPSTVARLPSDYDGPPRTVGASWGDGDAIVFATPEALWRVTSSGGTPEVVIKPGEDEYAYKLPQMLPGGRAVLFTLQKTLWRWDDTQIVVRSLVTGDQRVLLDDGADARYVPSGHLVFVRRGTLMAVPFDPERLTLTGAPVAMIDGIMQAANNGNVGADSGAGQFAIAAQGRLIYVTGGITPDEDRALVWVDRDGSVEPLVTPRLEYMAPRLAPNAQRILVTARPSANNGGDRIWIHDVARERSPR